MSKLLDIQKGYFNIVKKYFGHFYDEAKRNNVSAYDIANSVMRNPRLAKITNEYIDETFGQEINLYWNNNFRDLINEVKKLKGLRLYFSGDISPADSSIINRLGLYADTIIIPDPTLRSIGSYMTKAAETNYRNFLLIKTAIKILDYEKIVLANTPQPIALIFPSEIIIRDEGISEKTTPEAILKTVEFLNENLHEQMSDYNSWIDYFSKISNYEKLEKAIKNKTAFLFDSNVGNDLKEQVESLSSYSQKYFKDEVTETFKQGFSIIPHSIMGRMGQSLWHITKSEILNSYPVQDAYVSWHYLKWQMQNQKINDKKGFIPSYLLGDNFKILGNTPLDILVKLREGGELQDLRDCINKEINNELSSNQEETIKQIQYNLFNEFKRHQKQVEELDKKYRKALKSDIPSMIVGIGFCALGIAGDPWLA
jgi:gas vesicle protein